MINYLETKTMQKISPAEFTEKFINQTNRSVFLTGKAGTGKTTLLKKIIDSTHKNTVVVAPTGIAALNAGGVTLHSMFQLPFGAFLPIDGEPPNFSTYAKFQTKDTLFRGTRINKRKIELIRNIELLIIDEVSMLRSDLLDAINVKLQKIRKSSMPFGGVQVLFIGDLLQLPPVVKDYEWSELSKYYRGQFFFHSQVLLQNPPLYIELDKIFRQSDEQFVTILNNLRNNKVSDDDLKLLNKCVKPDFDALKNDGYITLTTHNRKADKINEKALESLAAKSHFFEAEVGGEFPENIYPIPEKMELKVGAQVMFIKNDISPEKRYYNGKIGRVITLDYNEVEVLFPEEKKVISVEKYEWENVRYHLDESSGEVKEKVIGTFVQYPLKLAWAITVHKSQGLTFEKAVLDINEAFAPGQAYVALSRLTGLDGLIMQQPLQINNNIQTSQDVIAYANQKKESQELKTALELQTLEYLKTKLKKAFNWDALASAWLTAEYKHKQASSKSIKGEHSNWFSIQTQRLTETLEPSRKFRAQIDKLCRPNTFDPDKLHERVEAAHDYFIKILEPILRSNIKTMLLLGRKKAVKQYLEELMELDQKLTDVILKVKRVRNLIEAFVNEKPLTKENIISDSLKNYKQVKVEIVKNELRNENSSIFDSAKEKDIALKITKSKAPKNSKKKKPTHLLTLEIFNKTKSIAETAIQRNLAESTINGHLGKLIREEKISINDVLDKSIIEELKTLFGKEMPESLTEARELCKNKYSFETLRLYKSSLLL